MDQNTFCPFSLIRVFGVSLVEDFDAIESGQTQQAQVSPVPNNNDAVSSVINQVIHNNQVGNSNQVSNNNQVGNSNQATNKDESSSGSSDNKSSLEDPVSSGTIHSPTLEPPPRDSVLTMVRKVFTPDPPVSEDVTPATEPVSTEYPTGTDDPVSASEEMIVEKEAQVYDFDLQRQVVHLLPRVFHLLNPSKCYDLTSELITTTDHSSMIKNHHSSMIKNHHSSMIKNQVCRYLSIMLGSQVYEALIQEAGGELSLLYTCEPKNATVISEGAKERKEGEEEESGSNLIPSQIQPIFDTLYALVTPSYDSVIVTQETSQTAASLSSRIEIGSVTSVQENVTVVEEVNETSTEQTGLNPTPVLESVLVSTIDASFESPSTFCRCCILF